jgi:hypothetical protein
MRPRLTNYRYAVIDEFNGVMRKFASKTEAQPYLTAGTKLVALPKQLKVNPYAMACLLLKDALL